MNTLVYQMTGTGVTSLDILLAVILSAAALLCLGGMYAGVQIEKEARGFRVGCCE